MSPLWMAVAAGLLAATGARVAEFEWAPETSLPDRVGGPADAAAQQAPGDTAWIADWSFDAAGGGCTDAGWTRYDNRILDDGSLYWNVRVEGGCLTGRAAVLENTDPCRYAPGLDGAWDYSIVLLYRGASSLSFELAGSNFLNAFVPFSVEADSGCTSEDLDYASNPADTPSAHRTVLFTVANPIGCSAIGPLALPDYGAPTTTHCVYLRFLLPAHICDEDTDPCLGNVLGAIDAVSVAGGFTYSEDFESSLDPHVSLVNSAPAEAFGDWSRLYAHLTENEKCQENTTCAWSWVDPTLPATDPSLMWGPGQRAVRNWLDNVIVSPWVSLASTPGAQGTLLSFRRFPGSPFANTKIVQGWRVRSRYRVENTDTTAPGDSIDCVSLWGHASQYNSLTSYTWLTSTFDMTTHFDPAATEIQVSFRTTDWQLVAGDSPPATLVRAPGPYLDRVRVGRRFLTGPGWVQAGDDRWQAQDCFPTFQNSILPGQHFSPSTDRFGTCAFSRSRDASSGNFTTSPNLVTGDSIHAWVQDMRLVGGIAAVRWYGSIVSGPHAGKAPAPFTVGASGFFEVTPDTVRNANGFVQVGQFFVDLDDTYFRGGDQLRYLWTATDAAGGFTSYPDGLAAPPSSVLQAETATGGLLEVSFLPTIDWSPEYLARIAAHPTGDLDPTPEEIAASQQRNCILYSQKVNDTRRSGDAERTSFMYTLDVLGYRGAYDVYDHQATHYSNNHLGGRATVVQATGYALIIDDNGRLEYYPLPDGTTDPSNLAHEKIDQAQWYRDYLAAGAGSEIGRAALWLLGENVAFVKSTNPLVTTELGLAAVADDQALGVNPDVAGVASFTWAAGGTGDFTTNRFALAGGCPAPRRYDAATAGGTAVATHRYKVGPASGGAAMVVNKNAVLGWNTVWCGFNWFDARDAGGSPPGQGAADLVEIVFAGVLPAGCERTPQPVDRPPGNEAAVPVVTRLHANAPNPFNPVTRIEFDLAQDGRIELQVFDVAGKLVRTLVNEDVPRGYRRAATWNGLDASGAAVPSGVYFYRLVAPGFEATRKMMLLK